MRKILFYKALTGESPIENFLDNLTAKQAKKVTWVLQLIEMMEVVPVQYFKKLTGTDEIWEVRVNFGNNTFRLFGFFSKGNWVILTNGFSKKTNKVPAAEIKLAESRKKEYQTRKRKT